MTNITTVNLTSGVPTGPAGAATVSTIDALIAKLNANGRATIANSAPVVLASQGYATVTASQTAAVLGTTGATGDYLDGFVINPGTTSPGNVVILDSGTTIATYAFGTLSNTAPFYIKWGAVSVVGPWKVTTGSNVSITAFGNFT